MSPFLHFNKNFTILGTVLVYTVIRNAGLCIRGRCDWPRGERQRIGRRKKGWQ